jgi:rod shape-determining protein MreB
MVVDIGAAQTEVGVISSGRIVVSRSLRVAGDELDQESSTISAIKINLFIGERMAEQAKMQIGSAYPLPNEKTMAYAGVTWLPGLPESIEISSVENS